jgi:hypothetical protein
MVHTAGLCNTFKKNFTAEDTKGTEQRKEGTVQFHRMAGPHSSCPDATAATNNNAARSTPTLFNCFHIVPSL